MPLNNLYVYMTYNSFADMSHACVYMSSHSYLTSLADNKLTLMNNVECWHWQPLSEEIRRLFHACNLEQLDFWCRSRGELPDVIDPGVNVTPSIVHARALDQEYACVVVLRNCSCCNLLVSHHVHHAPQIYAVKPTQGHTAKFALCASNRCH